MEIVSASGLKNKPSEVLRMAHKGVVIDIEVLPSQCKSNLRWNGFYSEKHSLFYTATPKAACTTFKWWFADLVEKADAVRTVDASLESSPELLIHDRFWRVAPDLTHLDAAAIAQVLQQTDTFSFCLVRNPFTRIFSAWQSKLFRQEVVRAEAQLALLKELLLVEGKHDFL